MNKLKEIKRELGETVKPLGRPYKLKEVTKFIRFSRAKLKHMKPKEPEAESGFVLGYN